MIIDAMERDVKVKCRKFKNAGRSIGTVEKNDGTQIPISFKRSDIIKVIRQFGEEGKVTLNLEGKEIKVQMTSVYRDLVQLFPHHIEFKEI